MFSAELAEELVDSFDAVFGANPGTRSAHAKGVCCEATFTATANARALTRAPHMQAHPVRCTVRFSNGSGDPNAKDRGREPRGMAVKFHLDEGSATDIVSITWPVFVVRTPEEVLEFMRLRVPDPATGAPDMAALGAFFGARPEAQRVAQILLIGGPVASYVQAQYNALHAFRFVGADGSSRYGRYSWEPALGIATLTKEEAAGLGPDYLQEDLLARLAKEPASFALHIQIAGESDDPDDPTAEWPPERESIVAGHLEITGPVADQERGCERLVFDPTRLCDGIEPSGDPILHARPQAYAVSSARRMRARRA